MFATKALAICISCLVFHLTKGISVCDIRELTEREGRITSPNYPENYPENAECTLRIKALEGQIINIEFEEIDLEDHADDGNKCTDSLTLQTPSVTKQFCGSDVPDPFTSDINYVDVIFKSDGTVQQKGFSLKYKINAVDNMCPSRSLPAGDGIITSPNFPNKYGNNQKCVLTLPIPKGFRYDIKFISFNIQYERRCIYDRLIIKTDITGRKLCGTGLPPPYSFRGKSMTLDFLSDGAETGNGFKMEYRLVEDTLPLEQCMCTKGREYVHLELAKPFLDRDTDDISFSFKTSKKNGILLYTKGKLRDYMFVAIKRGVLDIQLDLGTGVGRKKLGSNLADDKWHNFKMTRRGKNITVELDTGRFEVKFWTPWIFTKMDLPKGDFYFAGFPLIKVPFHLRTANFVGCVKDVKVDKLEPLKSAVQGEQFYKLLGQKRVKKCLYSD